MKIIGFVRTCLFDLLGNELRGDNILLLPFPLRTAVLYRDSNLYIMFKFYFRHTCHVLFMIRSLHLLTSLFLTPSRQQLSPSIADRFAASGLMFSLLSAAAQPWAWAGFELQGIIVPSGCCVHVFVLMPPGCRIGHWLTGEES